MNISHDGTTVSFKTEPEELFLAEKSGAKPNTVRILDNDEYETLNMHPPKKITIRYQEERFSRTLTNLYFAKLFGKVIVIFSWTNEEHHHSSITNASYAHTMSIGQLDSVENTLPRPHSVLLPRSLILDLSKHRRGRTHAEFISDLLGAHITSQEQTTPSIKLAKTRRCPDCGGDLMNTRPGEFAKCSICRTLFCLDPGVETVPAKEEAMSSKEPSIDKKFHAITISTQTLAILQDLAHGQSMDSVIIALHESYLNRKTSTWRPRHD
jgi:hypothetical protein